MSARVADLGDVLAHTFATPAPTTPTGPRVTTLLDHADRDNATKLGHLDFLISEMAHVARVDGCPPALADLIAQARRITEPGRAAA